MRKAVLLPDGEISARGLLFLGPHVTHLNRSNATEILYYDRQ